MLSLDQHFREMEQRCGDWNPKAETERGGGRGGGGELEGGRGLALNGVWGGQFGGKTQECSQQVILQFCHKTDQRRFSEQGTALRDCLCSLREEEHKGVPGEGGPGSGRIKPSVSLPRARTRTLLWTAALSGMTWETL